MDRSQHTDIPVDGSATPRAARPDYGPALDRLPPFQFTPRHSDRLTADQVSRIIDGGQRMLRGRGISLVSPMNTRYEKFVERAVMDRGHFGIMVAPYEPNSWNRPPDGPDMPELVMNDRPRSRYQFFDVAWTLDVPKDRLLGVISDRAGRPQNGRAALAQDAARDLDRPVYGPWGDLMLTNERRMRVGEIREGNGGRPIVTPGDSFLVDDYGRPTDNGRIPMTHSSLVLYGPDGRILDVQDTWGRDKQAWILGLGRK
jgi:hypothetical protein